MADSNAKNQGQRKGIRKVLHTYFFWTSRRGSFHYDVMVTLILVFIFVTPHLWSYGDKPTPATALRHPIQVSSSGGHGMIVTVRASDVNLPADASDRVVRLTLRQAIEPVTGDAVFVEHWETATDEDGNAVWKVWAHR